MRFPAINSQPRRSVIVPEFSGGLNCRDGITNIRDNQLSDSLNMWFKDGALRTRPNLLRMGGLTFSSDVHIDSLEIYRLKGGSKYKLIYIIDTANLKIHFYWFDRADHEGFGSIEIKSADIYVCFGVEHNGNAYVYLSNQTIWEQKIDSNAATWKEITNDGIYVPTILTHCRPQNSTAGTFVESTNYENYNLLTNKYKIVCSTVNPSIDAEEQDLRFKLPQKFYEYKTGERVLVKGTTVTAVHTYVDADGKTKQCTHTVTVDVEGLEWKRETTQQADGFYMWIRSRYNYVVFSADATLTNNKIEIAKVSKENYIEDNLEITATYTQTADDKNKVFQMSRAIWFGGSSSGIDNGTRVFLCRNANSKFKNLIQWSAANNPLYFPAENNAFVGETQQRVEAFGKQGDKLIIFKENETWCTHYVQNTEISSSDLINQNVIDVQSQGVYFPLVLINGHIGCDCPNTVQLCRNRLVWLHSSGKVYSLVSENNYTERSIYEVSGMISKKLKKGETVRENATSADWRGYYVLSVFDTKFLMDYNSYGYTHCYSYTKTEDANINIPWYIWKANVSPVDDYERIINVDDEIVCVSKMSTIDSKVKVAFAYFDGDNSEDRVYDEEGTFETKKIVNYAISKFFDFDAPNNYKNIHSLGFSFGYNNGDEIKLSVITEDGTEETGVILDRENEITENMPQFMKSVCVSPSIRSVVRMGIKFSCDGVMIIDGMNIIYRITGRAR